MIKIESACCWCTLYFEVTDQGHSPSQGHQCETEVRWIKFCAGAIGLSAAALLATQQADAASEVTQLAAGDNRLGIILVILIPVVGWVLFNILGPALAQLDNMSKKPKNRF